MKSKSVRNQSEEIEAISVIINIRMMQDKVYGKSFAYDQFNGNTLDELRTLQEQMIQEYNATFTH